MEAEDIRAIQTLTKGIVSIVELIDQYLDAHLEADSLPFEESEEWEDPESQIPSTVSVQAN